MKLLIATISLFIYVSANAQVDILQSSPSVRWKTIENKSVQLIYPDYLGAESIYIANLVEHYSKVVGQSYEISEPKQFTLLIRPEVATPNGFVTLSPRRSEWFSSSQFFPAIGSTEWYQTLAIHEYRHINQFDHFAKSGGAQVYKFLMGDFGSSMAMFLTMPSWYFEGDAVWAETKYTDGGRGRSPRFLARLKALVLSDNLPSYDEFLNGTYKTNLPNHYVYGYVLVSYGTQKYGEKIWAQIAKRSSEIPLPVRFYGVFQGVTGQRFEDFYNEAMSDLKKKWTGEGAQKTTTEEYNENFAATRQGDALYYIHHSLDSYPTIIKEENGEKEDLTELNFSNDFMQIRFGSKHAVTTEYSPDNRYGYKGTSDLILIELESGSKERIISHDRIYNPGLNPLGNKIIAVRYDQSQSWEIAEFSLDGSKLQSFSLPNLKIAEAQYLDDGSAVAIVIDKEGRKSLVEVDLKNKTIASIYLPASRNIITSLFVDKNKNIIFEGQYKGKNEIFAKMGNDFYQCTSSQIGAYSPSSDGEKFYYSDTDGSGTTIKNQSLAACWVIERGQIIDFNYLSDSPSDNYNKFPLLKFENQLQMYSQNSTSYQVQDYSDFDRQLLIPHTWGLALSRGGGLGFQTDNYLRTLGVSALVGSDPEEGGTFGSINFDIKKYNPILSLSAEGRERVIKDFESENETGWQETQGGVDITVPYVSTMGLYGFSAILKGMSAYSDLRNYQFNEQSIEGSSYLYKTSSSLLLTWSKKPKFRSIASPWRLSYQIQYENAEQPSVPEESSYQVFQEGVAQTPGLFSNDGFSFSYSEQIQADEGYRFLPVGVKFDSYAFSRGYEYKSVPYYQKVTGNYFFPVSYRNINIPRWYYLRRIYGNIFFDSTYVTSAKFESTLNSYGAEARFESVFFRVLPLTFGTRVVQRLLDHEVKGELFLATPFF